VQFPQRALPALIATLALAGCLACAQGPRASARAPAPRCGPSQLSIRATTSNATQSAFIHFVLRNTGPRACAVRGRPAVGIFGSSGRRLPVRRFVQGVHPRRVRLAANRRTAASFTAQWMNYCGPRDDPPSPRVALPGTRTWIAVTVVGQALSSPVCSTRHMPSRIGVNELQRGAG
jgi:hypothetical protein